MYFFTGMVEIKIGMDFQITTRKGKKYIFVLKARNSTSEPSFKYKFNENEKELIELHKILDDIVDNNSKEFNRIVRDVVEERASNLTISIFNKIAFSNYEKLFPET